MTTTQAAPNGYRVSPPPSSAENPAELNPADLPANQDNTNQLATDDQVVERQKGVDITPLLAHDKVAAQGEGPFPASAYHVPPKAFAPSPHPRQPGEYAESAKRLDPLPHRCQFMFSDGRQCTMARSDIHPSLCFYHADREEQLFGDPSCRFETRKLDFPELYSACRDLSTAAGVNRALAQVFRLLAQRRISRQEAATFAKLGHLLLQSIRTARSSCESPAANVYLQDELRGVEKVDQELSHVNKVAVDVLSDSPAPDEDSGVILSEQRERRISPEPSSEQELPLSRINQVPARAVPPEGVIPKTSSPISAPTLADRAEIGRSGEDEESRRRNGVQHSSASTHSGSDAPSEATNSLRMNTSAASICNSPEISTYENAELKTVQNQHLQKNLAGAPVAQTLNLRNEPGKLAMAHGEVCGHARRDSSCPGDVTTRESGASGAGVIAKAQAAELECGMLGRD